VVHQQHLERWDLTSRRAASILRNFDNSHLQQTLERMEKLGLPAWRDAVGAALLSHITSSLQVAEPPLLAKAMNLLIKYEHWEHLALLELAIWKAECLDRMPDIKNNFSKAVDWMARGWKMHKEELRSSNAIAIVVSLVRPFLDPHSNSCAV
jgi:hypothetical protein